MQRILSRLGRKAYSSDILKMNYWEADIDGRPFRIADTNPLCRERIETLFDKEPTTIPWLETFQEGEVFVDIGANIGLYSTYAAVMSPARVYAFEPESQNYAELNKNIFLNGLHQRVTAYCLAMSDEACTSTLMVSRFGPAYSHHDFGQSGSDKSKHMGKHTIAASEHLAQGCASNTLDALVASGAIPQPHHIKIDVDGIEERIIRGATQTLASPTLRSILIEIDYKLPGSLALLDKMKSTGWRYSMDQVRINRHEILDPAAFEARVAQKKGGQNFIFFRDNSYADYFSRFTASFVPPHPPGVNRRPVTVIDHSTQPKAPAPLWKRLERKVRTVWNLNAH